MATFTITREHMIKDLNEYFTGLLESWSCSGEISIPMDKAFVLYDDWLDLKGDVRELILPNRLLHQSWHLCGTSKLPEYLAQVEAKGNTTFVERLWKRINNYN